VDINDIIACVLKSHAKRGKLVKSITLSRKANFKLNRDYFERRLPDAPKYLTELNGLPVKVSGSLDGVSFVVDGEDSRIAGLRFSEMYGEGMVLPPVVVADNAEG